MKPQHVLGTVMISVLALAGSMAAQAQSRNTSSGEQRIRCESIDSAYQECRANAGGGTRLVRQIAGQCVENETWGARQDAVWVSDGCRAEFAVRRGNVSDEELDAEYNTPRYRSANSYYSPRYYGYGGRSWQDASYRAVCNPYNGDCMRGARPYNYYYPTYRGHAPGYAYVAPVQRLQCSSAGNRRSYCRAPIAEGAYLVRSLSNVACIEGDSWGWDSGGVWVSNGCRAEFDIW